MDPFLLNKHNFVARQAERVEAARDRSQAVRAQVPPVSIADQTAQVRLYDYIDSWGDLWGISADEFAQALDDLPPNITTIEVMINSGGGGVFEGSAITNQLRRHSARVIAIVDGLAASAASGIACAADELVMMPGSQLMIHKAWGICIGNADEMIEEAELLEHISADLAAIYAAKAGGTTEEWLAVMAKDTWYSAQEAVAAGLADRVGDAPSTAIESAPTANTSYDGDSITAVLRRWPQPEVAPSAELPDPADAGDPDHLARLRTAEARLTLLHLSNPIPQ